MRKLLLATTAMLGGLAVVGTASAQVKLNDGTTVDTPFTAGGGAGNQSPSPGNIVVHLNGRVSFTAGGYFDQAANHTTTAATNPSIPGTTQTITTSGGVTTIKTTTSANPSGTLYSVQPGTQKLNNIAFGTTLRLYPGFDGVAANGMQYGGYAEIRFDQKGTPNNNSYSLTEGTFGNVYGGATATPDIAQRSRDSAYLYQSWGYIGSPSLGIIRGGMLFTSSAMLLTGTMENFDDGGWHGANTLQAAISVPWPFVNNGILNGANSIQYLSPQFFGFDVSATYQPNSAGGNVWSGCVTGTAGLGCDRLSSSSDPSSWARRTNMVDLAARYRGVIGPVGLTASGGWITSGRVLPSVNGITTTTTTETINAAGATSLATATSTVPLNAFNTYKNLNMGLAGVQLSYAGVLVGGHVEWGNFGYQAQLMPVGGAKQVSWVGGASYTMGPATFGVQYINYHSSQGQSATIGARNEQGPWLGAQYILAPGMLTYLGYGYTEAKQSGYDWAQGAAGPNNNVVHSQQVVLGTIFNW